MYRHTELHAHSLNFLSVTSMLSDDNDRFHAIGAEPVYPFTVSTAWSYTCTSL